MIRGAYSSLPKGQNINFNFMGLHHTKQTLIYLIVITITGVPAEFSALLLPRHCPYCVDAQCCMRHRCNMAGSSCPMKFGAHHCARMGHSCMTHHQKFTATAARGSDFYYLLPSSSPEPSRGATKHDSLQASLVYLRGYASPPDHIPKASC